MKRSKGMMTEIINMTRRIAAIGRIDRDDFKRQFNVSDEFIEINKLQLDPKVFTVEDLISGELQRIIGVLETQCLHEREKIKEWLDAYSYMFEDTPSWMHTTPVDRQESFSLEIMQSFYKYTFLCQDVLPRDVVLKYKFTVIELVVLAKAFHLKKLRKSIVSEHRYLATLINDDAIGGFIRHIHKDIVDRCLISIVSKIDVVREQEKIMNVELVRATDFFDSAPYHIATPSQQNLDKMKVSKKAELCYCKNCIAREFPQVEYTKEIFLNFNPYVEVINEEENLVNRDLVVDKQFEEDEHDLNLEHGEMQNMLQTVEAVSLDTPEECVTREPDVFEIGKRVQTVQMSLSYAYNSFDIMIQFGFLKFSGSNNLVCREWYFKFFRYKKFLEYPVLYFPHVIRHPVCNDLKKHGYKFDEVIVSNIVWDLTYASNSSWSVVSFIRENWKKKYNCTGAVLIYAFIILHDAYPTIYFTACYKRMAYFYVMCPRVFFRHIVSLFKPNECKVKKKSLPYVLRQLNGTVFCPTMAARVAQKHFDWGWWINGKYLKNEAGSSDSEDTDYYE